MSTLQVFSPYELNDRYNDAFRRGSLEDLVSLYETEATLSPAPNILVHGQEAIRERLVGLLSLKGMLSASNQRCVLSGDIALLSASWLFEGTSSSGQAVRMDGDSSKVARKQSDGSWKYVIDLPLGISQVPAEQTIPADRGDERRSR